MFIHLNRGNSLDAIKNIIVNNVQSHEKNSVEDEKIGLLIENFINDDNKDVIFQPQTVIHLPVKNLELNEKIGELDSYQIKNALDSSRKEDISDSSIKKEIIPVKSLHFSISSLLKV